jgi:hypothetical protein
MAKYEYLDKHNWFNRMDSFMDTLGVTLLESLDRDWVRAGIQVERKCTRRHPFAFDQRIAELRIQQCAVKLRISELALGTRMSCARQGALEKCSPNFTLPTTLAELFSLKHTINKEIKTLETNYKLCRAAEQAETRKAHLAAGDLAGAKALWNIIIAEETREMWRQIKSMDDKHDQGVTMVQIPADRDLTNPNCKT